MVGTHAVLWLGASPFRIHFFGTLGGLTSGAPTTGNREDEQYHKSCNGNKDSPGPTSTSSPPAEASLSRTATLAILASLETSSSSPLTMTHRIRDVFPRTKKRKEQKNTYSHHEKQEKLWVILSLGRNQQGKKKVSVPSASLTLSRKQGKEGRRSSVSLIVLLRISVTLSLPWLKWVFLSQSWSENKKKKKRCSLCLNLSVFRFKWRNKRRNNQGQPFTGKHEGYRWQDMGKRPTFNARNLGSNWRPTKCWIWESAEHGEVA